MFSILQLFMKLAPTFLLRLLLAEADISAFNSFSKLRAFLDFWQRISSRRTYAYPGRSNSRNPWVAIDALSTQLSEDRLVARLHLLDLTCIYPTLFSSRERSTTLSRKMYNSPKTLNSYEIREIKYITFLRNSGSCGLFILN